MYHARSAEDVLKSLDVDRDKGLSHAEINQRTLKYGKNILEEKAKISPWKIFLSQFMSPLVWILFGAIIISTILGEYVDSVVIAIILVINAILGFIQEYKAEKAIEALKKMASLKARVIRNGIPEAIDSSELVPGDILVLEAGEKIPADARIIDSVELQTQEAALTGESNPVKKNMDIAPEAAGVADRNCVVHSGTVITNGKGHAVVIATGMRTEIGKIAHMIQEAKPEPTPLQKKLKQLAKWLGILTVVVCFIVFTAGVMKGGSIMEFLIAAVSLAVAAIPEGLAIVVTIAMALGVQRMVKRNALMRKLPSVETLGCTTVICTDKTGTLTHNQMTVKKIYVDNEVIDVSGSGYHPDGVFSTKTPNLELLLMMGALNNDAELDEKKWEIIGDPTEGALLVSARKAGIDDKHMKLKFKRIAEIPFTSERKCMTTMHQLTKGRYAYVKGAPDVIMARCSHVQIDKKIIKLDDKKRKEILDMNEQFASSALRVMGFALKKINTIKGPEVENNLVFVGMQAMIDPPREEAKLSIEKCREAGIRVIMITGDHKTTAVAIAKELGLEGKAVTGHDLHHMNLDNHVEDIAVYARVDPKDKMLIVEALKKKGHVVAMTGDGVNDAPALKRADIGISMGISGTDVAKEASDMILTDDNFASIVNAIEEGRGIYENIKKFVNYLLSSNMGEILILFVAILLGWPLPLIAVQILWINLITDGLPALALSVDPTSKGIMSKSPRRIKENIISMNMGLNIMVMGILICIGTLFIFNNELVNSGDLTRARTLAFSTIVVLELVRVYMVRAEYNLGMFSNKYLILAVLSSIGLQMLVIYTPLSIFFRTVPLVMADWGMIGIISLSLFVVGIISSKSIRRMTKKIKKERVV